MNIEGLTRTLLAADEAMTNHVFLKEALLSGSISSDIACGKAAVQSRAQQGPRPTTYFQGHTRKEP